MVGAAQGLLDMPRDVLALVGSHLAPPDRNACVEAAKGLRHVHESFAHQNVRFSTELKLGAWQPLLAHVLALKPRLDTLFLKFVGFRPDAAYADLGARVRAFVPGRVRIDVRVDHCSPRFVRDIATGEFSTVSLTYDAADAADDVLEAVDAVALVYDLWCTELAFNRLDADAMARVRNVAVNVRTPYQYVSLRNVDPDRTAVRIFGLASMVYVIDPQNLSALVFNPTDRRGVINHSLSLLPRARSRIARVIVAHFASPDAVAEMVDAFGHVQLGAEVLVVPTHKRCLRFLDHLRKEGFTNVSLYAMDDATHLLCRAVQLVARREAYGVRVMGGGDPAIGAIASVGDVCARLAPSVLDDWYFLKFM